MGDRGCQKQGSGCGVKLCRGKVIWEDCFLLGEETMGVEMSILLASHRWSIDSIEIAVGIVLIAGKNGGGDVIGTWL